MRMTHLAVLAACSAFAAAPAFAQGTAPGTVPGTTTGSSHAATSGSSGAANPPAAAQDHGQWGSNARQMLIQDLQKAGFTNIRVEPRVFIVHARNSQGQPVLMRIGPDSMEAVTALTGAGQQHSQGAGMHASNGSGSGSGTVSE